MSKEHNYCFTAYNLEELNALKNHKHTTYIIAGTEICPTTKRLHYQGYLELNNSYTLKSLKKIAPSTHFEKRKGSQEEAIDYCKKDNNWEHFGTPKKQGQRMDLEALQESLERGDSLQDISKEHFSTFLRYNKGIMLYKQIHCNQKRNWPCELHLHIGVPGSGKSHKVHTENPNAYWLARPTNSNLYYYNYQGESTIIIDDFTGWIPFTELLTLADKYPKKVNTCGNYAEMLCSKVFITSNVRWEDWYNWNSNDKGALERRITSITYYNEKYTDTNIPSPYVNSINSQDSLFNKPNYIGPTPTPAVPQGTLGLSIKKGENIAHEENGTEVAGVILTPPIYNKKEIKKINEQLLANYEKSKPISEDYELIS